MAGRGPRRRRSTPCAPATSWPAGGPCSGPTASTPRPRRDCRCPRTRPVRNRSRWWTGRVPGNIRSQAWVTHPVTSPDGIGCQTPEHGDPATSRRDGPARLVGPPVLVVGAVAVRRRRHRRPGAVAGRRRGPARSPARAGCSACHGADGQGGTGPAWDDVLGTEVTLDDGTTRHRRRGLPDEVDHGPERPGRRRLLASRCPRTS